MPFPAKTGNTHLLIAKPESTYGTFTAPSASTDVKELALSDRHTSLVQKGHWYDGMVGPSPGNTGFLPRIPKLGAFLDGTFPMRFKGFGAAYSASNKPNVHDMLLFCGYAATGSFTGGSEKWTYDPSTDVAVHSSGSYRYYHGGQIYEGAGLLGIMSYESQLGAPPLFTFVTKAIQNADVTDGAPPAATYTHLAVVPFSSAGATITLGSFLTAAVRKVRYESGRNLETMRPNLNGTSVLLGWVSTERNPRLTVTIERTTFVGSPFHTSSGIDYYKLAEAATQVTGLIQFGSVQYNRLKHNLLRMQLADVAEGNDGGVKTVDLTFEPKALDPVSYDWENFVAD